jgi:hypothetical protein
VIDRGEQRSRSRGVRCVRHALLTVSDDVRPRISADVVDRGDTAAQVRTIERALVQRQRADDRIVRELGAQIVAIRTTVHPPRLRIVHVRVDQSRRDVCAGNVDARRTRRHRTQSARAYADDAALSYNDNSIRDAIRHRIDEGAADERDRLARTSLCTRDGRGNHEQGGGDVWKAHHTSERLVLSE